MAHSLSPTPEALLAHADWVRSLAHCLVSDPEAADDLAQEAWVSALEAPSVQVRNMRGWLAQILRNLLRQKRRATTRRDRHERAAARREPVPSASDVVERVSSHRVVVEAVLKLDEPYRTPVLLRFFEAKPPRKIAQELEIPVSTVHTHIQRGLKMLRARLDHLHGGDRRSWLFAVLPLVQREGGVTATLMGALYMKTKLQILFGALLVAIGLVAAWPLITGTSGEPVQTSGPASVATPLVAGEQAEELAPQVSSRTALQPIDTPAVAEVADPAPAARLVRGRLLDSEARPLPGMALGFGSAREPGEAPIATTSTQGSFEFLAQGGSGRITVAQEGWTTVMPAVVNAGQPPEHALVVAAPSLDLAGRVVDEFGVPVSGASVRMILPEGFRTRFTENSDAAANNAWAATAAEDGVFDMEEIAQVTGAQLVASNPGFDDHVLPLPAQNDLALEIVLRRTARAEDTISGQVIDDRGAVVEGAWVGIGASSTRSDAQGNFTLKLTTEGPMAQFVGPIMEQGGATIRILAVKEGYRPARLNKPVNALGQQTDWPSTVVLRLGQAPLTIAGRVVDENGDALPEARVWVNDPSFFGQAENGMQTLEGVMSGSTARWNFVTADSTGNFELTGLADREYVLRAILSEDLLMVDTGPIQAGRQDVVIQRPAGGYYETVAGQVVSNSGIPVSGVTVTTQGDAFSLRVGDVSVSTNHVGGRSVRTDAQGRFEIEGMPRTNIYLRLDGQDILPIEYGRGVEGGIEALSGGAVESLVITVPVRVHVRVDLDAPDSADQIQAFDIEQRPLPINVFSGNSRNTSPILDLVDGRTPVFVLPDTATTMVFLKNGEEVRTVNLGLIPGEVNQIRW